MQLATALRRAGNRVDVELSGKKLRKAMEKANHEQIAKVIVLGETEVIEDEYALKDMTTGDIDVCLFDFS